MLWALAGKGSTEESSLTSGHRALLLGWLPGPPFRAEMLLCAAQPQLCSCSAESQQTGAGLVVCVCCEAEQEGGGGRLEHLTVVLFTGSSVQATIGAKLCFLGMPRLQSSLWGSAHFLPTCQAGLGSILAWCRLAGKVGRGVLAALHMAQHGRT